MPDPNERSISFASLGMTQPQIWRYLAEGPSALTPEQRAKMAELYPDEVGIPTENSVALPELKRLFFAWLDSSVAKAPSTEVKAFNLCLYEGADCFEADFFGCPKYSADDPDWACTWCYEAKDRFHFSSEEIEPDWEEGLRLAKKWLKAYLQTERAGAETIKKVGIATVGFSDGDLHVVWPQKKKRPTTRQSTR